MFESIISGMSNDFIDAFSGIVLIAIGVAVLVATFATSLIVLRDFVIH